MMQGGMGESRLINNVNVRLILTLPVLNPANTKVKINYILTFYNMIIIEREHC